MSASLSFDGHRGLGGWVVRAHRTCPLKTTIFSSFPYPWLLYRVRMVLSYSHLDSCVGIILPWATFIHLSNSYPSIYISIYLFIYLSIYQSIKKYTFSDLTTKALGIMIPWATFIHLSYSFPSIHLSTFKNILATSALTT